MKCPIDGTDLQMSERQGVEIDYCPKCRGIWLDRGELDKLIERSKPTISEEKNKESETTQNNRDDRSEGWLSNLFDF